MGRRRRRTRDDDQYDVDMTSYNDVMSTSPCHVYVMVVDGHTDGWTDGRTDGHSRTDRLDFIVSIRWVEDVEEHVMTTTMT